GNFLRGRVEALQTDQYGCRRIRIFTGSIALDLVLGNYIILSVSMACETSKLTDNFLDTPEGQNEAVEIIKQFLEDGDTEEVTAGKAPTRVEVLLKKAMGYEERRIVVVGYTPASQRFFTHSLHGRS